MECTNKVINWQRLEPYATGISTKLNVHSELKTSSSSAMPLENDSGSRSNIGRSSVLQNSENNLKASSGRLSVSQNSDSVVKETKSTACMCADLLYLHIFTFNSY
jgi:katanin p80 WD40 repeat-containing subunit B1